MPTPRSASQAGLPAWAPPPPSGADRASSTSSTAKHRKGRARSRRGVSLLRAARPTTTSAATARTAIPIPDSTMSAAAAKPASMGWRATGVLLPPSRRLNRSKARAVRVTHWSRRHISPAMP